MRQASASNMTPCHITQVSLQAQKNSAWERKLQKMWGFEVTGSALALSFFMI
jgi:hypothetical protein